MGFAANDQNLYRFVTNNPTNDTDPTGLQKGGRGTAAAYSESALLLMFPGEARESLLKAVGDWKEEAAKFADEVMAKCPNLTREQRLGVQNAARHLYWMMLLTARYGKDMAGKIGDMHEYGERSLDSLVDQLHNSMAQGYTSKFYTEWTSDADKMAEHYKITDVPGSTTFVTVISNLRTAFWNGKEDDVKKAIRKEIFRLVGETCKDPLKGPLIVDLTDSRIKSLPGWREGLPTEKPGTDSNGSRCPSRP